MSSLPATNRQVPDHSIMDHFGKQSYLGNQYSVFKDFTVSTSEIPLILLQNSQTGSPQNMVALFQNLIKVVENTAAKSIILNIYQNPTFSAAGSALTPVNLRPAYGILSAKAIATFTPTVSANGTLIDTISAAALSVGSSNQLNILDNLQNLLITGIASASGTAIDVIAQWFEL